MRVFLDDARPTPPGWVRVYWPSEAIALLETGRVRELSLDHDLGDDARGTGYDVVLWIEAAVALRGFVHPKIVVHSANASARAKMLAGVRSIGRLAAAIDGDPKAPRFELGAPVRVLLNERNRTPRAGRVARCVWHHNDARWNYYLEEAGRRVAKRYLAQDLERTPST